MLAADRRDFYRLSLGETDPHRNHAAVRQIDMRQRAAGFNQDSFPDQLDDLEMRTKRLELCCRQGTQQMIG
jgi:hypothetical protein